MKLLHREIWKRRYIKHPLTTFGIINEIAPMHNLDQATHNTQEHYACAATIKSTSFNSIAEKFLPDGIMKMTLVKLWIIINHVVTVWMDLFSWHSPTVQLQSLLKLRSFFEKKTVPNTTLQLHVPKPQRLSGLMLTALYLFPLTLPFFFTSSNKLLSRSVFLPNFSFFLKITFKIMIKLFAL